MLIYAENMLEEIENNSEENDITEDEYFDDNAVPEPMADAPVAAEVQDKRADPHDHGLGDPQPVPTKPDYTLFRSHYADLRVSPE
jgi:hypothetical protein